MSIARPKLSELVAAARVFVPLRKTSFKTRECAACGGFHPWSSEDHPALNEMMCAGDSGLVWCHRRVDGKCARFVPKWARPLGFEPRGKAWRWVGPR